jgi:hypothetical protein
MPLINSGLAIPESETNFLIDAFDCPATDQKYVAAGITDPKRRHAITDDFESSHYINL